MTKNNESFQHLVDSYQVAVDVVKQVATLSAGSIVVIGTFLTDIFPPNTGPVIKNLITVAFVMFALSLISTAITMYRYSGILRYLALRTTDGSRADAPKPKELDPQTKTSNIRLLVHHLPLASYTVGVLCFGLAVVLHLYHQ